MTGWIKAIHFKHDGWTIVAGKEAWISDAGRIDAQGRRVYRADGTPWGQPSWVVGDVAGLYFSGTHRVPVLVEIIAPPEFNPELVEVQGVEPGEGERWPWVTGVRGLHSFALDQAPTLADLGVENASMQQRSRLWLKPEQRDRLLAAFKR